jgi:hypothetical protein
VLWRWRSSTSTPLLRHPSNDFNLFTFTQLTMKLQRFITKGSLSYHSISSKVLDKMTTLLFLFAVSFSTVSAFICQPPNQSINSNFNLREINNTNWTIIANTEDDSGIYRQLHYHPFRFVLGSSIEVKTEITPADRVEFMFSCIEFEMQSTIYLRAKGKARVASRYCAREYFEDWKNTFGEIDTTNKIALFYVCDSNFEGLTILGESGKWSKTIANDQAKRFLKSFKSSLMEKGELNFVDLTQDVKPCEHQIPICDENFSPEDDENQGNRNLPTILILVVISLVSS